MHKNRVDIGYHYISIAIGMCRLGRNKLAVRTLDKFKSNLKKPYIGYVRQLIGDEFGDMGAENTNLIQLMKRVLIVPFKLVTKTCVPEFELEHQACQLHNSVDSLFFHPLAVANFLLVLLNSNMGHHDRANAALNDFYELVHHDVDHHIHEKCRAVPLEMLGICQQLVGDHQAAYRSFTAALQQPYNDFYVATLTRLLILLYNVLHSSNSTLWFSWQRNPCDN